MYALNNEILESFSEINKAIYRLVKSDADSVGITVVQLKTLYTLSYNPDSGLGELAEKLRLTNSTVSGVIDRLVHSGLVERVVPPENRRSVSIHLTEKGKSLLDKLYSSDSILIKKLNEVLELPKEEIVHLLRLHKLVLSKLKLEEERF
ncbi:MarR family winged helix-turn-helix transcriptional regulator [Neobacillus ginsengisoli]|uniref:DNA-binding MarR family transcriptional regulator n=1 Tax=Neobacillus ginsengisoli TaxID=904295 RepID=A0ABT9XQK7_9BACI|nr:MarR family transcriptional regulator [Neobacillus ginsengisoli]MDQ0197842.1 DNA-binding MarR family transcriptional regulator [Neobacillus ginsengisoli]